MLEVYGDDIFQSEKMLAQIAVKQKIKSYLKSAHSASGEDGINAVIGVFVGGYEAAKVVWNEFPDFMGEVGRMVAWKMGAAFRSMLRDMAIELNVFMKNVGAAFGFENTPSIDVNKMVPEYRKEGGKLVPNYPKPTLSSGGQKAMDAATSAFSAAQGVDYVGQVGDAVGGMASSAAAKLRELAGSFGGVGDAAGKAGGAAKGAADKAKDAWAGLRDVADKTTSAFQQAGQGAGGIIKGLISGTLSWKDALSQALSVALKLLDQLNIAGGGKGIFGGGFLQGLLGGLLGFASGGYTGNGAASRVAGFVHGGEYVFSKKATDRIGVGALEQLHRSARGYANGGHVAPPMPRVTPPANVNQPLRIELVSRFDADGGFETAVERSSRPVAQQESAKAAGRVAKAVPSMVDARADERQVRRIRPGGAF